MEFSKRRDGDVMRLEFTEAQEMLKRIVLEFVERELTEEVRKAEKIGEISFECLKRIAGLGFFGIPFPREYGGAGMDMVSYAITMEELLA